MSEFIEYCNSEAEKYDAGTNFTLNTLKLYQPEPQPFNTKREGVRVEE